MKCPYNGEKKLNKSRGKHYGCCNLKRVNSKLGEPVLQAHRKLANFVRYLKQLTFLNYASWKKLSKELKTKNKQKQKQKQKKTRQVLSSIILVEKHAMNKQNNIILHYDKGYYQELGVAYLFDLM